MFNAPDRPNANPPRFAVAWGNVADGMERASGGDGVRLNPSNYHLSSDIKGLTFESSPHSSPLELWLASKTRTSLAKLGGPVPAGSAPIALLNQRAGSPAAATDEPDQPSPRVWPPAIKLCHWRDSMERRVGDPRGKKPGQAIDGAAALLIRQTLLFSGHEKKRGCQRCRVIIQGSP